MIDKFTTTFQREKMMFEDNVKQHILVVDDDMEIVSLMRTYLEQAGYQVSIAYNGETALHVLRRERPTLVLLDLMLPGRDGWQVTRVVRADKNLQNTPIIMLTARIDDTDKILGLELGADDYITKPFNPREVVARIRSVFRRISQDRVVTKSADVLKCGALELNTGTRQVTVGDETVTLTPTEFKLLHTLIMHPNFVFTRAELAERAFGYDYESMDRTLDNHIRNLRKKIEPDPSNPTFIHTIYGIGYKMVDD